MIREFIGWLKCSLLNIHSYEMENFRSGIKYEKCRICGKWRTTKNGKVTHEI